MKMELLLLLRICWIVDYSILLLIFCWQKGYNLAVMHIGAPACGMNAAVRSFVRNCIYRGDNVFGIHDGIEGLMAGNIKRMDWWVRSTWFGESVVKVL